MTDQQIVREWDPAVGEWRTRVQAESGGGGGGNLPDPSGEPDGDVLTVASGAAVWSPGGGSQTLAEILGGDPSAGNNNITDLLDPGNDQDAATKKYVDDNAGGPTPGLAAVLGESGDAGANGMTNLEALQINDDLDIGGELNHDGPTVGFYGHVPVTRFEVPASPTAQDVVDALVAVGLITQAAE